MGVLNVTPDSFFDKGRFFDRKKAVKRALEMVSEGADIIDIGGESTRPGAEEIKVDEELDRVIPVISAIADKVKNPISIDTRKSKVALEAVKVGASIVNDVSALRNDPLMAEVVSESGAAVILMHMKGTPKTMQKAPRYKNIVKEISAYLEGSVKTALAAGIKKQDIIIDPGIGFGKTLAHNLEILRSLRTFKSMGFPLCVGTSRKSFIGKLLECDEPASRSCTTRFARVQDRLYGTIATGTIAITNGADILRVHDVREAVEAARVTDAIVRKK